MKNLDKLTKNHKEIDLKVSGFMPENKEDRLCPVRSYRMYLEHLHPENKFLWQLALENVNPKNPMIWYGRQHLGKNTLGHFMTDVSQNCQLSKIYTNHSIRVTGATVLMRMNFSSAEIMLVTGHKSVQSLTRYQHTQNKQKLAMGNVMHQSLTREENQIVVPLKKSVEYHDKVPSIDYAVGRTDGMPQAVAIYTPQPVQNKENSDANIVPFEPNFDDQGVPDFDLLEILKEVEEPHEEARNTHVMMTPTTTATTSNNVLNNIPKSLFHNCTIQNITFNMNK